MFKNVKELEERLENYPKTYSNEIDTDFRIFRSDVYALSQEYKKGELYIYSREEWEAYLKESINDCLNCNDFDNARKFIDDLEELNDSPASYFLNGISDFTYEIM